MRKSLALSVLLLLGFTLTGCGTDVKKVGDEIGSVINAAVPLKSAAFLPNILGWLGPSFDVMSILALVAFIFLAFAVVFGPKEGQNGEVTRGFIFIAGKVVLALMVFLVDLFGKALWPAELTAVGIITKLGWGWPLKADLDLVTAVFALSTMTFFPLWHVGVEILWTLYTIYAIAVGSFMRNTEPLKRAIIGWIFWILSAFVWWFVVINGIGAAVSAGNLLTSSGAHVNAVFIGLTWFLMIVSVTEPFRATITNRIVPETVRVQASSRIEELLEALVGGYVGGRVAQQQDDSHHSDDTVIHAEDPQARAKLPAPRQPKEEPKDNDGGTDPLPPDSGLNSRGNPSAGSATRGAKASRSVGVQTSSRAARADAPSADGSRARSSGDQSTDGAHARASLTGIRVVNPRTPKEEHPTGRVGNGNGRKPLPINSDARGTTQVTGARVPLEEPVLDDQKPVVQAADGVSQDEFRVVFPRDPRSEDGETAAFHAATQPLTVANGDDGSTLYRARADIPDALGISLIPAGSYIIPDETAGAVSNAGVVSYGQLVTWDLIEKIEVNAEVSDD